MKKLISKEIVFALLWISVSPLLALLVIFGIHNWDWDSNTHVNQYLAWVINSRYSSQKAFIYLGICLSITAIISFVVLYLETLRGFTGKLIARYALRFVHKSSSAVFYFWGGTFLAFWFSQSLIPFLPTPDIPLIPTAFLAVVEGAIISYAFHQLRFYVERQLTVRCS